MWEPQHLIALWASTLCYRDNVTFLRQRLILAEIEILIIGKTVKKNYQFYVHQTLGIFNN
jgi:hypothetical protein